LVKPAGLLQKFEQVRVIGGERRQPEAEGLAFPPQVLGITRRGESVTVKYRTNVMRGFVGKRIAAKEA
jgi:hypothetical protein